MNIKKVLIISAILTFIGIFLSIYTTITYNFLIIKNHFFKVILNYFPGNLLGLFFLLTGLTIKEKNIKMLRKVIIILFIVLIIVSVLEFCAYLSYWYMNIQDTSIRRFLISNWFRHLPFANIFSEIYMLYIHFGHAFVRDFFPATGDILIVVSFIISINELNLAARNLDYTEDLIKAERNYPSKN